MLFEVEECWADKIWAYFYLGIPLFQKTTQYILVIHASFAWSKNNGGKWSTNFYFKILPTSGNFFIFVTEFCAKMFSFMKEVRENDFAHRRISKWKCLEHFSPSFLGQNGNFRYIFYFDQVNDAWITRVVCGHF